MSVIATFCPAFAVTPVRRNLPAGLSLVELTHLMPELPDDFLARGAILIGGVAVQRELWPLLRPRADRAGPPLEVTFHAPPRGGGGDSRKSVFALLASVALTAASGFIAGGGLATRFGLTRFAAGSLAASALASGVSLVGALAVAALSPPPSLGETSRSGRLRTDGTASVEGNLLEPNAPLPRVLGERKVFPPLAAEPLTYFEGEDEVVEAVFALAGPHRLRDIRIGAASAADLPGVELQMREGWPGSAPQTLVRRQARTEHLRSELPAHQVDEADGKRLDTSLDPALAVPQPVRLATRDRPDEHWLHLVLPQGLHREGGDQAVQVPVRLRLRRDGSETWQDLPELHFRGANLRQMRATIRLVWGGPIPAPSAALAEGWVEARRAAPGQTAAPSSADFVAHSSFGTSDDAWLTANNLGSTGVTGVALDRYTATVRLDPASFEPGRYEIEIRRGAAFRAADWNAAGYTVAGSVWNLFGWRTPSAPEIPMTRDRLADSVVILRSVSIWNETPVAARDLALIAVRARGRSLERLSVLAGGWVRDLDPVTGQWGVWTVTDNPAPHLRDIYIGALNMDPVPAAALDDAGLVAWRSHCVENGLRCNAVIEGQSAQEAAEVVAACGYGRPYMAERWGVIVDRDRRNEPPVQLFGPRNSRDFAWRRALARLPEGLRCTFRDETRDYEPRQITVFRPGVSRDTGRLEQVNYEGLVTEAEVRARATYDLAQPELRGTYYTIEAPAEAIVCRRGSLVAVQHDSLDRHMGAARIVSIETDAAGDCIALQLDAAIPILDGPVWADIADLAAVPDMSAIGARSAVRIRRDGGAITLHALAGPAGSSDRIQPVEPIPADGLSIDTLVAVGRAGAEVLRLIVWSMEPREDLTWTLTLVDEAPQLWSSEGAPE